MPPATGRHRWRRNDEDVRKWAELFQSGVTIVHIAKKYNVDPNTVSQQLHSLGLTITPGHHMVEQLPLRYSPGFIELIDKGPDAVLEFVKKTVWGIQATPKGEKQLRSFCEFVHLHHERVGVKEIARKLSVHRSTISEWRDGTDQPYLVRTLNDTTDSVPREGWKFLPMHLTSGGGKQTDWIQVPQSIGSYSDLVDVVRQIRPLEQAYERARYFGLTNSHFDNMRLELLAYLLGIMVGDSGKLGGEQSRFFSMHLDLQLTLRQPTNERMGQFVMMCTNNLGLEMTRIKDKPPTGRQLLGEKPSPAYRWSSERSPLLAWLFSVCLGLKWGETTTTHPIRMNWIHNTPRSFRIRFIQGAADSDGTAREYVVDIASVPNAEFFAVLLQGLGATSAAVAFENGIPLRTKLRTKEAANLPIFNEFIRSYRYERMLGFVNRKSSP